MTIHLNGNAQQVIEVAMGAAEKIDKIGNAARQAFVERNNAIDAMITAFASGDHLIMLGKPGTSKTALGNYFAQAMGLRYFYQQGNPDLTREDFFGPISTAALRWDKWDREWSGLAVAEFGFVDEIGKASGQVQNLVLGAMEERTASIANTIHHLPLHTFMSGSNETIHHNPALWDRFTLRILVKYVQDTGNFTRMLRTDLTPPDVPVTREELACLRAAANHIAMQPNPEVDAKLVQIKTWLETKTKDPISDRRWRRALKIAAGVALLGGRDQIEVADLVVLKWMLWQEVSQIDEITRYVEEQCNQDLRIYRETEALVNELQKDVDQIQPGALSQDLAMVVYRAMQLRKQLDQKTGKKFDPLKEQVALINKTLEGLGDI